MRSVLDDTIPATACVAQADDALLVLTAHPTTRLHRLEYQPSLRRYRPLDDAVLPETGDAASVSVACDAEGRAWTACITAGELAVSWSSPHDTTSWSLEGTILGSATDVCPELVPFSGGMACLFADVDGLRCRLHRDGEPPERWSPTEQIGAAPADALSGTARGEEILAVFAGGVWLRDATGFWREVETLEDGILAPALSADLLTGTVYLCYGKTRDARTQLFSRRAEGVSLPFAEPELLLAWPGVSMGPVRSAQAVRGGSLDMVFAAAGSDAYGHFARHRLPPSPDQQSPITMQHAPPPGAQNSPTDTPITFRITDDRAGVDVPSLRVTLNETVVTPQVRGVPRNLLVEVPLPAAKGPTVTVTIEAADRSDPPRTMVPFVYQFSVSAVDESFRRGDANADGRLDISDSVATLRFLFAGSGPLPCAQSADSNNDHTVNLADVLFVLGFLFNEGPKPPAPYPDCGPTPSPTPLPCLSYPPCK